MRSRTSTTALALLLLAAISVACGGGSSGGRNPTVIDGNVKSASAATASRGLPRLWRLAMAWWRGEATAQVPGIAVTLVGTTSTTTSDEQGFFRLEGNQFGPNSLEFSGNGADVTYPLTLPFGGEVDLVDVQIHGSQIQIGQHRIHFDGPITGIDCNSFLLQVLSGEQVAFRVRLTSGTVIEDQNGAPLQCTDLGLGRGADVQGTVRSNGDVTAVVLQENPAANATSQTTTFQGTVASKNCPSSIVVAGDHGNVTVSLSSSTAILDSNGQTLSCDDLMGGDAVEVTGNQTGFGVDASQIQRFVPTPTPSPTPIP